MGRGNHDGGAGGGYMKDIELCNCGLVCAGVHP